MGRKARAGSIPAFGTIPESRIPWYPKFSASSSGASGESDPDPDTNRSEPACSGLVIRCMTGGHISQHLRAGVGVGVGRQPDGGVAENCLHSLQVRPALDQQRRTGVTEIMNTDARKALAL